MVVAGKNTSESMKTVKACRHCKALQAGTGNPAAGRFIQADTIIPQQQGVQGWDRYAYTNNNPVKYTDPSGHHYCDSKYATEEACNWYNQAPLPDDVCQTEIFCYQAYLTYNEIIFQLGRIPTEKEVLYMTAQAEGYSNKDSTYNGSGTFEGNFVEALARNYYQPIAACARGSWTCTESKLYKFLSGYQVWYDRSITAVERAVYLIDNGLNNEAYRGGLNSGIDIILNPDMATQKGWDQGMVGDQPWQWHNWIRPPTKYEALGWIYLPTGYGNYFWILTADQTIYFQREIKPK
jgi:hypothetical protein